MLFVAFIVFFCGFDDMSHLALMNSYSSLNLSKTSEFLKPYSLLRTASRMCSVPVSLFFSFIFLKVSKDLKDFKDFKDLKALKAPQSP